MSLDPAERHPQPKSWKRNKERTDAENKLLIDNREFDKIDFSHGQGYRRLSEGDLFQLSDDQIDIHRPSHFSNLIREND